MNFTNTHDFEHEAKRILPSSIYDYIASGAYDEETLSNNKDAFKKIYITPRVLRGSTQTQTDISLLNHALPYPLFTAPTALHCLAHPSGEKATISALNELKLGMTLSTMSSVSLEEIAARANTPLWFQLYIHKDRSLTQNLIQRAEKSGFNALVLTVDVPIMGKREQDIRHQFKLPEGVSAQNLPDNYFNTHANQAQGSSIKNHADALFDATLTWDDIGWIKSLTTLPIIIKGIMRADDAMLALKHGASGIIISNHGGRQLDTMPATIDVLPDIADTIQRKMPILIDGGFRRGSDVFKALALGADCIMMGRPILWALAAHGVEGVKRLFEIYQDELKETMILCGCNTIEDIRTHGRTLLSRNY
ncbi:MAG: alpha-hydroxy acid oxidase [Legionellaceae bacterium]|nr:alpha-hydroxy acid oxidase [Legionellaceae bacterium]